ncbi:MAG: hypothetical protein ACOC7J_06425 [Armatimonadota bacterium]
MPRYNQTWICSICDQDFESEEAAADCETIHRELAGLSAEIEDLIVPLCEMGNGPFAVIWRKRRYMDEEPCEVVASAGGFNGGRHIWTADWRGFEGAEPDAPLNEELSQTHR